MTTTTTAITIEQLEALASELATEGQAQRERLTRLCRAYARIIRGASPSEFRRRATHYGDEGGHYDSSYPPRMEYTAHTGPRSILIHHATTEDVATSSGFYHTWRRVTTRGALAIGTDGTWYRSDEYGTGALGQYAAHPGDHDVRVTIAWEATDDLEMDEIVQAETVLRDLAFPLVAARRERLT